MTKTVKRVVFTGIGDSTRKLKRYYKRKGYSDEEIKNIVYVNTGSRPIFPKLVVRAH